MDAPTRPDVPTLHTEDAQDAFLAAATADGRLDAAADRLVDQLLAEADE